MGPVQALGAFPRFSLIPFTFSHTQSPTYTCMALYIFITHLPFPPLFSYSWYLPIPLTIVLTLNRKGTPDTAKRCTAYLAGIYTSLERYSVLLTKSVWKSIISGRLF